MNVSITIVGGITRAACLGSVLLACTPRSDRSTPPAAASTQPATDEEQGASDPIAREPEPETPAGIECGETTCTPPEQCISHPARTASGPGVAETCGIPCDPAKRDADCPDGKHCVPIADGPGPVCR